MPMYSAGPAAGARTSLVPVMTEMRMTPAPHRPALPLAASAASLIAVVVTSGCAGRLPEATGLPRGAVLVAETPDYKAGFTAPDDGTIYIFHRGNRETYLRYSGPIKRDALFTIDPETNVAMIDDKPLDIVIPTGANHYQVYFRPARDADRSGGGGGGGSGSF